MSGVASFLSTERIALDVPAGSGHEVLDELAALLGGQDESVREAVRDDLVAREWVSSTGVGGGIAFPHARVDFLPGIRLAFVRTAAPVEFRALDGMPVDLFVAVAGPKPSRREYLSVLSRLAYAFRSPTAREEFRRAETAVEVLDLLERHAPQSAGTA
jgi:PTS system nitrogen regulatory IIA component